MMFRKILLLALCLGLIAGFAQAKVVHGATALDSIWVIPKTAVAPVIDGAVDSVWNAVDYQRMQYYGCSAVKPTSWVDLSGWAKMLWDDDYIYGLFYAQDDTITKVASQTWNRDAVEVYFDKNNTHAGGSSLSRPAFQVVIPYAYVDSVPASENWVSHGLEFAIQLDTTLSLHGGPSGYFVEFRIPIDSVGVTATAGSRFSLQWQQDDCDAELGPRDHISKWWNNTTSDDDWTNTSHWGNAILSEDGGLFGGQTVDNQYSYTFLNAGTAPTIDGTLDGIWEQANQLTTVSARVSSIFPVDMKDQSWRFYGLWDDNYIYGFFEVDDDTVTKVASQTWNRDAVEVYFDKNNTHAGGSSLARPAFQSVVPYAYTDSVPASENWVSHGMEFAIAMKSLPGDTLGPAVNGYSVEFRIPIDSVGITATSGSAFSFQLQTDDCDVELGPRDHITKWWNITTSDDDWTNTSHWGNAKLSGNVVGVRKQSPQVITSFALDQNYPNPFNPSTTISYNLMTTGKVRLAVYDLLGRQVAVLVNGVQTAGPHEVMFKAKDLSTGIYFYKLESSGQSITKKMALLK
jgi:hypothetical protein